MAEQILFNITGKVLENIGLRAVDEIASAWGFKTELDKLTNTINMIKDVLLDAEERQVESHTVRGWLKRLATAVYAADDLFDKFATIASQREAMDGITLSKEVRIFFSRSNQIAFAFNMSKEIKNIREELDEIAADSNNFRFELRLREQEGVSKQIRDQTHSYIDVEEVIGREHEKKIILHMMLNPSTTEQKRVTIFPIVGIGGLGKTTIAQLIYNDDEFAKQFELKLWVCVSDTFDVKEIVNKILKSATHSESQHLEMDQLQVQLRNEIGGIKYLLVLDDVWNENQDKWLKLNELLNFGKEGSKVLVTTRSKDVARIMGNVESFELAGLSEDKSWALFEKLALKPRAEVAANPNLVNMGKNIVKKCRGVPLAIRTLGASLCGADESKWLKVEGTNMTDLHENEYIMTILKLSYFHLWSPVKSCFAYCALFPKDHIFVKETLIDLWIAEGFITPVNKNEEPYEVGEEYFTLLLQRCFFQDITKDEFGDVQSCKMHDLMHDLALQVAGDETKVAKIEDNEFNKKSRHLSFGYQLNSSWSLPSCMQDIKHLRTIILPTQQSDRSGFKTAVLEQIISNFRCLRVLDLHSLGLEGLPKSISKLIHLRYLDLSNNPIEILPFSITVLRNLQTLKLARCYRLKTLPINMRKLTNLRSLDLLDCYGLTHMPHGIGELTSLRKLNWFSVKYKKNLRRKMATAELRDLKLLKNLRGSLTIQIFGDVTDPFHEAREANLSTKHSLTELTISVTNSYDDDSGINHDEAILEGLKPHPNLRKLDINWYRGRTLPSWAVADNLLTTLQNLVSIRLLRCGSCLELPPFSQLPMLKCLELISLQSVEYMESGLCAIPSTLQPTKTLFFPALEELTLMSMNNLKGWWKATEEISGGEMSMQSLSFPKLAKLSIKDCLNLAFLPFCPKVEDLTLLKANQNLSLLKKLTSSAVSPSASSSTMLSSSSSKLITLSIDDVEELMSLPEQYLNQLSSLDIQDPKLQSTLRLAEVFKSLSSLKTLQFTYCENLRSICEGLENLTGLEKLVICLCEDLDLSLPSCQEQLEEMPWKALKKLGSLQINLVPKLVNLPGGFQHLTNLRNLHITCTENLVALPEWINCLSSLEYIRLYDCPKLISLPESMATNSSLKALYIMECPGLTERCRGSNGADWYKIQHIPLVDVQRRLGD